MSEQTLVCGSCSACCKNFSAIFLHTDEGDDPAKFDTLVVTHPILKTLFHMLKHKPNGDCSYLGDAGCTIHEQRPSMCRSFDCRKSYLQWTKKRRLKLPWNGVWEAAKARLGTLTSQERLACIQRRNFDAKNKR